MNTHALIDNTYIPLLPMTVHFMSTGEIWNMKIIFLPFFRNFSEEWVKEIATGLPLSTYINKYCLNYVPNIQYLPVYSSLLALALLAPHLLWNSWYEGQFRSFFAIVDELNALEGHKFCSKNIAIVQTLEKKFEGQRTMFAFYMLKLFIQLSVCGPAIYFGKMEFLESDLSFSCALNLTPGNETSLLNTDILCVYTSTRVYRIIQIFNFGLISAAWLFAFLGLTWCIVPHNDLECLDGLMLSIYRTLIKDPKKDDTHHPFTEEMFQTSVGFAVRTAMPPDLYVRSLRFNCQLWFGLTIRNDLRFLILRLLQTDHILGEIYNTLLMYLHLDQYNQKWLVYNNRDFPTHQAPFHPAAVQKNNRGEVFQ